jgi:hypothetical protein
MSDPYPDLEPWEAYELACSRLLEYDKEIHHLKECLREVSPLVVGANFSEERYPLAYSECKALAGGEE